VKFIRKYKSIYIPLLLLLFTVNIRQGYGFDISKESNNKGNFQVSATPFISGHLAFSNSDKTHQNAPGFPVKILYFTTASPAIKEFAQYKIIQTTLLRDYPVGYPSVLELICKLTI
jgi:hypothetical protein